MKATATDVAPAADKATERCVRDALRVRRPGDRVLGGETGQSTGTGAVRWILDPIDGTVNYLYGLPQYAVSLAAERDGVVVAGTVRNIASGEEWTATRGGGAYRAGRRLVGSAVTDLGQALVATGFGYAADRRGPPARGPAPPVPPGPGNPPPGPGPPGPVLPGPGRGGRRPPEGAPPLGPPARRP